MTVRYALLLAAQQRIEYRATFIVAPKTKNRRRLSQFKRRRQPGSTCWLACCKLTSCATQQGRAARGATSYRLPCDPRTTAQPLPIRAPDNSEVGRTLGRSPPRKWWNGSTGTDTPHTPPTQKETFSLYELIWSVSRMLPSHLVCCATLGW